MWVFYDLDGVCGFLGLDIFELMIYVVLVCMMLFLLWVCVIVFVCCLQYVFVYCCHSGCA